MQHLQFMVAFYQSGTSYIFLYFVFNYIVFSSNFLDQIINVGAGI